jgi:hypothetical protein
MADKRESNNEINEVALMIKRSIWEFCKEDCFELTPKQIQTVIEVYQSLESREFKRRSMGSLTVDIECSEALTGLKAITREAKKATDALKELEEQQRKITCG